jgi:hypothetical protein
MFCPTAVLRTDGKESYNLEIVSVYLAIISNVKKVTILYVYHSLLTASIENRPYRGCYLAQKGIVGSKGYSGEGE